MSQSPFNPFLGYGLGYRHVHRDEVLSGKSKAQWFEALSENYMGIIGEGYGPSLSDLQIIREQYPVVLHSVSMNLGGADPVDKAYLQRLKELADIIEPSWMSDHLCWTSSHSHNSHDLLPLPYTQEMAKAVASKISRVQDFLKRPFLIENVSAYIEYKDNEMSEVDFINEVLELSGCGLLLDLNNIFVTSFNSKTSPDQFIEKIRWDRVGQIHLAGPTESGEFLIDTHDQKVREEVWQILKQLRSKVKDISLMIEWDDNIPKLSDLEDELFKAKKIIQDLE